MCNYILYTMFFNMKRNSLRKSTRQIRMREKSILIEGFLKVISEQCEKEETLTWTFLVFRCLNNIFDYYDATVYLLHPLDRDSLCSIIIAECVVI